MILKKLMKYHIHHINILESISFVLMIWWETLKHLEMDIVPSII